MKHSILLGALVLSLTAGNAFAGSVTYTDNTVYWDGFANNTVDDTDDVVGNPDIGSLTVTTDDNTGDQDVSVNFLSDIPDNILFGSFSNIRDGFFINTDSASTDVTDWDYFIQGTYDGNSTSFIYTLYTVNATDDSDYILSSDLTTLGDSSYRELHPVAIISTALGVGVNVTTSVTTDASSLNYDLAGMGITLGGAYAISYMNSCANDVIIGATPIPAPFLLFGSALFGIMGFRKFKNETV